MNIKKTGLYILIVLLLILLSVFICNKKSSYNDNDSSGISDSEPGQIGYMKDVTTETGEDGFTSTQSGAEYKEADSNKGKTYSARGSDSSSKKETVVSPAYKDDRKDKEDNKDFKVADEKKEAANKIAAKDKADTREALSPKKAEDVKAAKKTEKDESIKSAAIKADEKTVIAKNSVSDKAVSKDKIPVDSGGEKVKDKVKAQEDTAGSESKEKSPLKEEQIAANDEVKIIKQENEKINDAVDNKSSRLDRVHLYSGRVLTGTVTERGDNYIIITNEDKEKIPTNDIQGNEIIK